MQALKKHLSRSTQKIRRTINQSTKHIDLDYDILISTLQQERKALELFDKHMNQMIMGIESQMNIIQSFVNDYTMMFSTGSTQFDESRDYEIAKQLQQVADRMEQQAVKPFIAKSRQTQLKLQEYNNEIQSLENSNIMKQRYNKLLDYEIYENKYTVLQPKASTSTSLQQEFSDSCIQLENSKIVFEQVDRQCKQEMKQLIMKRYDLVFSAVNDYLKEILSEYYERIGQLSQCLKDMTIESIQPHNHETTENTSSLSRSSSMHSQLSKSVSLPSIPSPHSRSNSLVGQTTAGEEAASDMSYDATFVEEQEEEDDSVIIPTQIVTPSEKPEIYTSKSLNNLKNQIHRLHSPDITILDPNISRLSANYFNAQHLPDYDENRILPISTPRKDVDTTATTTTTIIPDDIDDVIARTSQANLM
jgi:hypothetical protein